MKAKHLTLTDRATIKAMLDLGESFKKIAKALGHHCSTISREVRNRLVFKKTGCFGHAFNDCKNRFNCTLSKLCENPSCRSRKCRNCASCSKYCAYYEKETCEKLLKPPYVCNGCEKRNRCTLEKKIYSAVIADKDYKMTLSENRSGISISEEEAMSLDSVISPLLCNGHSPHHICSKNRPQVMVSERTLYNYIDAGIFSARNIDLPRKVRFKPRKTVNDSFKVDRSCRIGRTYKDYMEYMENFPDAPVVQMDTVEGKKGGKVLLTLHFLNSSFMLIFLRDRNTSASVSEIFDRLYLELGSESFMKLFPVILTDNGSEFSDPLRIEKDTQGNERSRIFYCDPSSPFQKGAIENNNGLIRRILPKGESFDSVSEEQVLLVMNHINSYGRGNLNDKSPHEVFSLFYGQTVLDRPGAVLISPNKIILTPNLLK